VGEVGGGEIDDKRLPLCHALGAKAGASRGLRAIPSTSAEGKGA